MTGAWNGWYHITGSTYGTWLRGDPRGWRTRHHREHVEGDYKHPPEPGTFEKTYDRSRQLLKKNPVRLDGVQRRVAGQSLVEKLVETGVEVIAVSQDASHYHILAKFPDDEVRGPVGVAKKHASHVLRAHGLPGTVWGKRCRALPIRDRDHQVNVFHYIENHRDKDAWVWTFRDGMPWRGDKRESDPRSETSIE